MALASAGQHRADRRAAATLAATIIVAVILRVGAALWLGDTVTLLPGTADQISYHNLALRVLSGHGFTFGEPWWPATAAGAPTAHWSYLYTLYLVAIYALFGPHPLVARLFQAVVVGVLQPYLAYRLGCRLFGRSVGLVAAALTGLYAYFVYYAATLMTEPFYITAILASLYLAISLASTASPVDAHRTPPRTLRLALLFGLAVGGAVLLRQVFLIFVPVLYLWIGWRTPRRSLMPIISSAAMTIGLILPFTAFNYTRFHRLVLLNTNVGFAFYWANHPVYGSHFEGILSDQPEAYQALLPSELLGLDEAALDQALLRRGLHFVLDDPKRYLLLSLSRIPVFFMFWPARQSSLLSNLSRLVSFGLLLPFMLFGWLRSVFAARARGAWHVTSPGALLTAFMLGYTLIHLLSWALIRYRLPVDAVLILYASDAITDGLRWSGRAIDQISRRGLNLLPRLPADTGSD